MLALYQVDSTGDSTDDEDEDDDDDDNYGKEVPKTQKADSVALRKSIKEYFSELIGEQITHLNLFEESKKAPSPSLIKSTEKNMPPIAGPSQNRKHHKPLSNAEVDALNHIVDSAEEKSKHKTSRQLTANKDIAEASEELKRNLNFEDPYVELNHWLYDEQSLKNTEKWASNLKKKEGSQSFQSKQAAKLDFVDSTTLTQSLEALMTINQESRNTESQFRKWEGCVFEAEGPRVSCFKIKK